MDRSLLLAEWQEDAETLFQRYKAEQDPEIRTRLHALWLLRQGYPLRQTAKLVGVSYRSLERWLAWYREGGLAVVISRRRGGRQGRPSLLTPEQQQKLKEQAAQGVFFTLHDAVKWVQEEMDVQYSYWGIRSLFYRLKIRRKVPRPLEERASLEVQESWKKGAWRPPSESGG